MKPFLPLCLAAGLGLTGASAHAASLLLTNGVLHPVSGPSLTNGSLLVRDGKIAAIGVDLVAAADTVVDLGGRQVFPGLISPTTILGLQEIDSVRATRDTTEVGTFTPDVFSWVAVNPDSELIPVARANGYTHVQPIPLGGLVAGQSAVVQLDGWTIEDMAFRRAAGLHLYWPTFRLNLAPKERFTGRGKWKSPKDQVKEREERLKELDDFFTEAEAYVRALEASAGQSGFKPVPAWEAMRPVLRGEVPLFIHADEVPQIESAVEWALKRKLKMVLAGGRDAWRVAGLLGDNKIPVAYEHVFTQPVRDIDAYDTQFAAPAVLAKAGVKVSFTDGTDRFGASNIRNVPYAAAQAMAFGLPRDEAIKGLTLHPAEMLGVADRLGSLEPGKDATFFVADGDILDLRANVVRMWIGGREVSLESRHTRLYDRYRSRPKP